MPRTRSLKPSFFSDSELALHSPLHRIAYEGLWCWADKRGLLEDKPRELKVQILPFDECDFDAILADLSRPKSDGSHGFIRRYQANGRRFIHIRKFLDHQKPHFKETAFAIPAPQEEPEITNALAHPGPVTGQSRANPVPTQGQSGGFLVLGSGSLVLGSGNANPGSAAASSPEQEIAPTITAPAGDPETWSDVGFWAWAQSVRELGGLYAEGRPKNENRLSGWYSTARKTATVAALKEAFYKFGQSEHWRSKDPPYPFTAFMSEWRNFLPPRKMHAAS